LLILESNSISDLTKSHVQQSISAGENEDFARYI